MKNLFKYLVIGLVVGAFATSCEDDDTNDAPLAVQTTRVREVTYDSAVCGAKIAGSYTESGLCYDQAENPTTKSTLVKVNQPQFEVALDKLEKGTTYYVRAYASGNGGVVYGEQKSFTTYAEGEPIVKIVSVTKIRSTDVTVEGSIMASGGVEILKRGFCYSKQEEPSMEDATAITAGSVGQLITTLTELEDGQTYYVKAFAQTATKVYYSDQLEFKTKLYNKPIPEPATLTEVTSTSMMVKCSVSRDNDLDISERGFYYGTEKDVSKVTKVKDAGTGPGEYQANLKELTENTLYYFWTYATNIKGTAVSEFSAMSTTGYRPAVTTGEIGNIIGFSALGALEITALGIENDPVTEAGICWSTTVNPTIDDGKQAVKSPGKGTFKQINLRWLKPETTYHVRAYATNKHGTSYGADITFTTRDDLYKSVIRTFNAGSALPYTNAIKYADGYVVIDSVSTFQQTLYENIKKAVTKYGATRQTKQLVYQFVPIDDGSMGIQIRLQYTSADGGTNYEAITQYRVLIDENGLFTFSDMAAFAGNAKTMYDSKSHTAETRGYLDDMYNFLTGDKIVMDWAYNDAMPESAIRVLGQIRLSYANSPEKNLIFGTYNYSYTTETPLAKWY